MGVIILGNARCYHTMDWYRTIRSVCDNDNVLFATDLIQSEGHTLIAEDADKIISLFNIDRYLFSGQSKRVNLWRNFIKLLVAPAQVFFVKNLNRKYPDSLIHAHTMYYMFLCWVARVDFVGTPQGSEVLVRPQRSALYKFFAARALSAAKSITVDSKNMSDRVKELCGKDCFIFQNGVDTKAIYDVLDLEISRSRVVSFRGISPLYRTKEIAEAKGLLKSEVNLDYIYPLWEEDYKDEVEAISKSTDCFLGRVDRNTMYRIFNESILAISIPKSDSSPRSVYEAIFCGCIVAVTYNSWIDVLPSCMRKRLFIVDLANDRWLEDALEYAKKNVTDRYVPSEEALNLFDQFRSVEKLVNNLYIK